MVTMMVKRRNERETWVAFGRIIFIIESIIWAGSTRKLDQNIACAIAFGETVVLPATVVVLLPKDAATLSQCLIF